jgi:hypothetical protein
LSRKIERNKERKTDTIVVYAMDAENDRDHQEEGGILLSMEGQKMLSILESKSEFHSFVNGKINEALNSIADEFLSKVRASIQDLFFKYNFEVTAEEEKE